MGVASLFDAPFGLSSQLSDDTPNPLPVSIAGRSYRIDLKEYSRTTLDRLRMFYDSGEEAGEQSFNSEGVWRRNGHDWQMGCNQLDFDEKDSDRSRFWASKGVDVWSTKHHIQLLPAAQAQWVNQPSVAPSVLIAGPYCYYWSGALAAFTSIAPSSVGGGASYTDQWGYSGALVVQTSVATDGTTIWAACGSNGIKTYTAGDSTFSTSTLVAGGTFPATLVGYANGWLIAAYNNHLVWIDSTGTVNTIYDHPSSGFVWSCIAPAPNGIYVGGNNNGQGEVFYIGLDTSTGNLAVPTHCVPLDAGEGINCLDSVGGLMLLGTTNGLRVAQVNGDNSLTAGPYTPTGSCTAITTQGKYVWFAWNDYDSTCTGLARADLSKFTEPLVPAFASDLMTTYTAAYGQGFHGPVTGIVRFHNQTVFCNWGTVTYTGLPDTPNEGVLWMQSPNLVPSGTIDSGWIRYGTFELKQAITTELRHDPLNGTVTTYVLDERSNPTVSGVSSIAGSTGTGLQDASAVTSETVQVRLVLTRSSTDVTKGPVVRRWTLRSMATPYRTEEIICPIIMHNRVETSTAEGQDVYYDPLDEWSFLKELEGSRRIVTYQEGDLVTPVVVDKVQVKPSGWSNYNRWFEGLLIVRLLTTQEP